MCCTKDITLNSACCGAADSGIPKLCSIINAFFVLATTEATLQAFGAIVPLLDALTYGVYFISGSLVFGGYLLLQIGIRYLQFNYNIIYHITHKFKRLIIITFNASIRSFELLFVDTIARELDEFGITMKNNNESFITFMCHGIYFYAIIIG